MGRPPYILRPPTSKEMQQIPKFERKGISKKVWRFASWLVFLVLWSAIFVWPIFYVMTHSLWLTF